MLHENIFQHVQVVVTDFVQYVIFAEENKQEIGERKICTFIEKQVMRGEKETNVKVGLITLFTMQSKWEI